MPPDGEGEAAKEKQRGRLHQGAPVPRSREVGHDPFHISVIDHREIVWHVEDEDPIGRPYEADRTRPIGRMPRRASVETASPSGMWQASAIPRAA